MTRFVAITLACFALATITTGSLAPAFAGTADSIMENAKQKNVPPGPPQKSNKLDPNAPVSRPNLVCPVSKCVGHRLKSCHRYHGRCRCTRGRPYSC
jgi:hypothetical protein